jgi:hypothetical protein
MYTLGMDNRKIQRWQERNRQIKESLMNLRDMGPGSLSQQYNVCGNPTCRWNDRKNAKKHGFYFQLSYVRKGKSTTEFIRKGMVPEVRTQIANPAPPLPQSAFFAYEGVHTTITREDSAIADSMYLARSDPGWQSHRSNLTEIPRSAYAVARDAVHSRRGSLLYE